MRKPSPLKQVLLFTKLKKFWWFINETILRLDGSKLKSPSIGRTPVSKSPTDHPVYLGNIDCFVMVAYKYLQITTSLFSDLFQRVLSE